MQVKVYNPIPLNLSNPLVDYICKLDRYGVMLCSDILNGVIFTNGEKNLVVLQNMS